MAFLEFYGKENIGLHNGVIEADRFLKAIRVSPVPADFFFCQLKQKINRLPFIHHCSFSVQLSKLVEIRDELLGETGFKFYCYFTFVTECLQKVVWR